MGNIQKKGEKYISALQTFFKTKIIQNNMVSKVIKKEVVKKAVLQKAVTKKTSAKKVAPAKKAVKKTSTQKGQFKAMVCAVDGECFWTRDGRILQNLQDLHLAFGSMDDEIFLHHANTEKNDFADWIEHVLEDLDVAVALRTVKERTEAEKMLETYLKSYNR